jgi:Immunoglobulin-like domain of bacterial spore germination
MTGNDTKPTDLERRLREALHRDAERITPRDRRTEILAMINDDTRVDEPKRRWLIPVGAAASVALIGAIAWGASNVGGSRQLVSPVTSTSTTAPSPNAIAPVPKPKATKATSAPSTKAVTGPTTEVALPAYFVGADSGTGDRFGLYREFVRTAVPAGATAGQKARAAVALAMNAQPFTNYEPYLQPWSGTSVQDVTVTPSLITITLSGPGPSGFSADQTKLAVQELVWTAQAANGKGTIPVKFVVADGSAKLFGTYPIAQTYNRPPTDLHYQDLAPIWITSPARDQVFPAGAPVMAKGESCAFEATTQWQLKKGETAIRSGTTTASSGCPTRGSWQVDLGALASGDYTFRMYEVSMEDGKSVVADTSKPFSVK